MSRLISQYRKRNAQRFYLVVGVLALILILFFRAGLPSLINGAIYLQSLFGHSTPSTSGPATDFYGTLIVDDPLPATRESKLVLSGQTEGYERIVAYLNGDKLPSIPLAGQTFSYVASGLIAGKNTISILATTRDGKWSKKSSVYTITYLDKPPKLEITTPHDYDTVTTSEIKLEGTTDNGVTLRINHTPVVVGVQGVFRTTVRLKEGENTIECIASDDAGNTTTTSLKITYRRDE